jgi:hypothetical protein
MPSRFTPKPFATALLAAAVRRERVVVEDAIKEETMVVPGRGITPKDEARIYAAAAKVPRHVADAAAN